MHSDFVLFVGTLTTLLAVINPFEAMPVFMKLTAGRDDLACRQVARRSCFYAFLMMLFFLFFGNLIMRLFDVPLSMVRIVGGIILTRIGFELFSPSGSGLISVSDDSSDNSDVAFVPLATPIMFGPGAMATVIGMTSTIKTSPKLFASLLVVTAAMVVCMLVTLFTLRASARILFRIGEKGLDATTRMVGFFVSAMGVGLVFHGIVDALHTYGFVHMVEGG